MDLMADFRNILPDLYLDECWVTVFIVCNPQGFKYVKIHKGLKNILSYRNFNIIK